MVFLACPPPKMDHQPLSWALCGCGSDHCYSVTVLIVVWLSDPAAGAVGGGSIQYAVEPEISQKLENAQGLGLKNTFYL